MIDVTGENLTQITYDEAFDSFPCSPPTAPNSPSAPTGTTEERATPTFSSRIGSSDADLRGMGDLKLYMLNKPFGLLSQFSDEGHKQVWGRSSARGKDIYSVGRLDADSEGLLLLTNNNRLKTQLLDPKRGHERTYHVQVEGVPTDEQLQRCVPPSLEDQRQGVSHARAKARSSPQRGRPRAAHPRAQDRAGHMVGIDLTEGKNRQVRRMTAAVGLPTLRLIRVSMGPWKLDKWPQVSGKN